MLVNKRQEERERNAGWSLEIVVILLQAAGRQQFGWVGVCVWVRGVAQREWSRKSRR